LEACRAGGKAGTWLGLGAWIWVIARVRGRVWVGAGVRERVGKGQRPGAQAARFGGCVGCCVGCVGYLHCFACSGWVGWAILSCRCGLLPAGGEEGKAEGQGAGAQGGCGGEEEKDGRGGQGGDCEGQRLGSQYRAGQGKV